MSILDSPVRCRAFDPSLGKLLGVAGVMLAILLPGADGASAPEPSPQSITALQFRPLERELAEIANNPLLEGALVSIRVDSLTTGRTVFTHNPDLLVNPASVSKIFTTAAALALLYPEFRFKTEFYAQQKPDRGVIHGPLYVKGFGDPFLVNERLAYLAMELKALGIRKIEGSLVLDDSYFDDVAVGPGWSQDGSSDPYQAPMGALSLNFNSVAVLVFPGEVAGQKARVALLPDSEAFRLENQVSTVPPGQRTWVRARVEPLGRQTRVLIRGQIGSTHPGLRTMVHVNNPTWYSGFTIMEALRREKIEISKNIRRGQVPQRSDLVFTLRSPSLGDLVRMVNKRSQNFMAEQLYKTLGAEFIGTPGSWWKGQQVLCAFFEEEVGMPAGSYVLHNGSGLNDTNRVSASHVVALLRYMASRPDLRADFEASLAVAGADGTVAGRFTDPSTVRTMRLKTGSLDRVRSLAGYVISRNNEIFAFSFLVSRYDCASSQVVSLIDRFASTLARCDANYRVVDEVEVLPISPPDETLISPAGPPEGVEEAGIPVGEGSSDSSSSEGLTFPAP